MPHDPLDTLVTLSRRFGGDPAYVLAGGGNTSYKTADTLWVKASGHALATTTQDGFVALDRAQLQAMLTRTDWPSDAGQRESAFKHAVMTARLHPDKNQRPSVEALIHHLMPQRYVVHTHPTLVNAMTCCVSGADIVQRLFPHVWQPYVDPGLTLAQSLHRRLSGWSPSTPQQSCVVLLENHGLIVAHEDAPTIESQSDALLDAIRSRCAALSSQDTPAIAASASNILAVTQRIASQQHPSLYIQTASDHAALRWLVGTRAGQQAALAGPLTPDQIVYCRSFPMWIDACDNDGDAAAQWTHAWSAYERAHGGGPWVVLIGGVGALFLRESAKLAAITRDLALDTANVMHLADQLGGVQPMSLDARRFIETWEVEAYRRQIAAGG